MRPLRIAWSFVLIPKFFLQFFVGPLFIGLVLVVLQFVFIHAHIAAVNTSASDQKRAFEQTKKHNPLRSFLFQTDEPLPEIRVCRWVEVDGKEFPPTEACAMQGYDVTLRVDEPATFDPKPYQKLFNEATPRLHLCRNCSSSIIIFVENGANRSLLKNPFAYGIFLLAEMQNAEVQEALYDSLRTAEKGENLQGEVTVELPGYPYSVLVSRASTDVILSFNLSIFIVVMLWLALRSHRRLLDYLAINGALLPLVAASGKRGFYFAIWLLTSFRVLVFMIPSMPLIYGLIASALRGQTLSSSLEGEWLRTAAWIAGAFFGLGVVTVLGSIAELKHRAGWYFFVYRYVPILLCFIGGSAWFGSLLLEGIPLLQPLRTMIAATPILGLGPVMMIPLVNIAGTTVLMHIILSALLAGVVIKRNAQWFAAHLDQI